MSSPALDPLHERLDASRPFQRLGQLGPFPETQQSHPLSPWTEFLALRGEEE